MEPHEDLPLSHITRFLIEILGKRLTAVIAGVTNTHYLSACIQGKPCLSTIHEERLRQTYAIVSFLLKHEGIDTVRAFFIAQNPHLDDQSPAEYIRVGRFSEVMQAAEHLVHSG